MQTLLNVLAFLLGMLIALVLYVSVIAVLALSAFFLGRYWGSMPLGIMAAIVITKLYVTTVFVIWRKPVPDMEIRDEWHHRWHR